MSAMHVINIVLGVLAIVGLSEAVIMLAKIIIDEFRNGGWR